MAGPAILWRWLAWPDLTADDVYAMLQLRQDVFVVEQDCCYSDMDDRDQEATHLLGHGDDGRLDAYCRVFAPATLFAEPSIGRIIVSARCRGAGLGHEIVSRGVEYTQAEWPEYAIRIAAQAHLQAFYGQHGFFAVGEVYSVDDIPHIDMLLPN